MTIHKISLALYTKLKADFGMKDMLDQVCYYTIDDSMLEDPLQKAFLEELIRTYEAKEKLKEELDTLSEVEALDFIKNAKAAEETLANYNKEKPKKKRRKGSRTGHTQKAPATARLIRDKGFSNHPYEKGSPNALANEIIGMYLPYFGTSMVRKDLTEILVDHAKTHEEYSNLLTHNRIPCAISNHVRDNLLKVSKE